MSDDKPTPSHIKPANPADNSSIDPINVPTFQMKPPLHKSTADEKLDWIVDNLWVMGKTLEQALPLIQQTHQEVRKTNGRVTANEAQLESLEKREEQAARERQEARKKLDRLPHMEETLDKSVTELDEQRRILQAVTNTMSDPDRNYDLFRNAKERHDKALQTSRSWVDKARGYKDLIYVIGFILLVATITGRKIIEIIEEILEFIF